MSGATPLGERLHRMIERQVDHLVRLVADLLEASRLSRGHIELHRERTSLVSVVEAAIETSKALIEGAGHRLAVSLPVEPLWLEADPMRVAQALADVLNPAAVHTAKGGEIELEARQDGEQAVVTVRDPGRGIDAELLPRIFDRYAQGTRGRGGLGLGPSTARHLLELHGGTIEASSAGAGQGSEFVVRLPLAPPEAVPEALSPASHDGSRPRRISVVDDNRDAAESLQLLLQLDGHEVRVAYDGTSALGEVAQHPPDVVLLDIGLPDLDGHEVARRVRAQAAGERLLLVVLTGWGQPQDRSRSEAAGFDHHLVKPVEFETLQALLRRREELSAGG